MMDSLPISKIMTRARPCLMVSYAPHFGLSLEILRKLTPGKTVLEIELNRRTKLAGWCINLLDKANEAQIEVIEKILFIARILEP